MYWLLFVLYVVAESRPRASQCGVIPAGSNFTDGNGDNIILQEPAVTGKCEEHSNEDHNGIHSNSFILSCNGTTASMSSYGQVGDCSGTPVITPITLNGSCATMGCLGFNDYEYDTSDCTGQTQQNRTNEYIYWSPDSCLYNATQTCVNGQPQTSFYNNSACSGTAQAIIIAGQCIQHGNKRSVFYNATDNPCGTNATILYKKYY
eukprot:277231_1